MVAISTAWVDSQNRREWISSALNRPLTVSASALSYESPTEPTEAVTPAVIKASE